MRSKLIALVVVLGLLLGACAQPTPERIVETVEVEVETIKTVEVEKVVEVEVEKLVTPMPGPHPEAVIEGVEEGAEITIWTFWLSPDFDDYIHSTIARFQEAYPGVTVNWADHQATFQDDLRNAFAAGIAPDVINLSIAEGWVTEYASNDRLLALDDVVPQEVVDMYFPNLWDQQLVDGKHYQFPYYQGIQVDLINKQLYDQTGLTVEEFPETVQELPALCELIKESTGTLCDIRLTVTDLLAQMTYEGGVEVINEAGTEFTFDTPEAAAWLQMYVDMVEANTVDRTVLVTTDDRVGLDLFSTGQAAFYNTGPNLIREVRANNPALYGYLDVVPAPVGVSGVAGKGLFAMSVNAATKYPNASIALAQFFTNPISNLELSKRAAVYPSTPASYDDPFFALEPVAIEDSARPVAKEMVSKLADIVPNIPNKAEVNEIVLQAVQQALFNGVDPQEALSEAVVAANALIQ
ncbi:MAG: sugar ABC transporter substrate-binding protein [Chloroflexi bacterium]|nr:MAG: sugar ABC transporter substrate-binding protein [Chloroflexota bacterium]